MKVAILGFPQAGKRTLFRLLTGRRVGESRRPGECIEGVAPIRDPRVDVLESICHPQRKVYAENLFMLAPDVAVGEESRPWMDAARRCDLLCLVVRDFASEAVYHPAGSVDGARDVAALRGELQLADMVTVEKRLIRIEKEKRAGQSQAQVLEEAALRKCMAALEADRTLREAGLVPTDLAAIRSLELLTLIPQLVVRNVDEGRLTDPVAAGEVAVSCQIEEEISEIEEVEERRAYLEGLGLAAPGVDRVNAAAYAALGLMSFYTVGPDEVRAWTIRIGSVAPTAGGKIHSDIERGFIRVEVVKYDAFVAAGGEKAAKESGNVQLKGKDYVIEDGDICHFLFNV